MTKARRLAFGGPEAQDGRPTLHGTTTVPEGEKMARVPKKASIAPQIPPDRAVQLIRQQIERLDGEIMGLNYDDPKIDGWL